MTRTTTTSSRLVRSARPRDPSLVETREVERGQGRRGRLMVFRSAPAWSFTHWALPITRRIAQPAAG